MVWYSHLIQNFPQFIVIHTVKGFGIVNKAEIDVFLEPSCFFEQPRDSAIHIHVSLLPQTPFPSRLPHYTEQSSLCSTVASGSLLHFKYSSVHMTIPNLLSPSPTLPPTASYLAYLIKHFSFMSWFIQHWTWSSPQNNTLQISSFTLRVFPFSSLPSLKL